jgi:hypothetical protein
MIAHHTGNLLEFESSCTRPPFTHQTSSSSTSSSTVPEMILSISLQSFTESDDTDTVSLDDTLSWGSTSEPGARGSRPVVRTRSIFGSYWSSPAHVINDDSHNDEDDLQLLERMRTLKMPTVGIVGVDDHAVVEEEEPLSKIHPTRPTPMEGAPRPRRSTIDDDVVNYRPSLNRSQSTPIINRRCILPPPPPPKVIPQSPSMTRLSSLARRSSKQSPRNELAPYGKRPWSSTTALLAGGNDQDDVGLKGSNNAMGPSPQSCLRKPRYSLSGQDLASVAAKAATQDDDPSPNFVRSVSFQSEVRVVEYTVPQEQRRSQEGWSKFFIGQVE